MIDWKTKPTLLLAAFGCATLLACGGEPLSQTLMAPAHAANAAKGTAAPHGNSGRSAHAATCGTQVTSSYSGVFGPAGGTLLFGTSRLIIPGGALRDTVTISATILDGDNSRVRFQPHGLQFAKSAGLLLDTSGCSLDDGFVPDVVYLDDLGHVLERIPAVYDPHWHTIAAPIDHFSGYAIAF